MIIIRCKYGVTIFEEQICFGANLENLLAQVDGDILADIGFEHVLNLHLFWAAYQLRGVYRDDLVVFLELVSSDRCCFCD